jgi:hypothetical protein
MNNTHPSGDFSNRVKPSPAQVDRFRRWVGLALGLGLALVFGFATQVLVRLEMPGVPFAQPPLGPLGNLLALLIAGGIIGLLAAWPDEPLYGMVLSAVAGAVFITILTLYTAGPTDPQSGATVMGRIVSVVFAFLPIVGIVIPLMMLLVWTIGRLVGAYRNGSGWARAALPVVLLLTAVSVVGLLARLPASARQELSRTHRLIQDGLAATDRQSLPEPLRGRLVGDFYSQADPGYLLTWDNRHVNRYGIPRPGNPGQEAVVRADFDNDWTLACLYGWAEADPICKGIGQEFGKAIFSSTAPDPFEVDWDDFSLFTAGLVPGEAVKEPLPGATVYHVALTLPASGNTLTGRMAARYTNGENVPLKDIYFRLYPNQAGGRTQIEGVSVDGAPATSTLAEQDTALRITLPGPLQPGESTIIEFDFSVQAPEDMAGNYGLLSHQQDIWALDAFLPTIAVYDERGWQIQPTPPNGDNTFHDAAYYLVQVTAPSDAQLVASGSMVGGEANESQQKALFAAGPGRDFYLAASPRFESTSEQVGQTTITAYSLPELAQQNLYVRATAAEALRVFNQRYGEYPYSELDLVSIPMEARGIEYPGVVGLALGIYSGAPGSGAGTDEQVSFRSTVAHEVAHQWFYNLVGNDQSAAPWLDEALAQYAVYQYFVDTYGEGLTTQGLLDYWGGCVQRTGSETRPVGLSAGEYPTGNAYVGAVYCRGPLFILALREAMGINAFDAFLRDYVEQNRWGIATETGFRRLAEKHCQCNLGDQFGEYLEGN